MKPAVIILLAEDEKLIQAMLEEALCEAGFSVVTADDGNSALAIVNARHGELAGLVSDVRLGSGPDGWQVARHARELRPDLAVIYMTGDSAVDWAANGVPKSVLVQKPFAPAQVVTALATLLNEIDSQPC